jgi:hypothetical protein
MSGGDGGLPWVARAGYAERFKSGSVRGSGCNSPGLLGGRRVTAAPMPIKRASVQ